MTNMTVQEVARIYKHSDFKLLIADYLDRHHLNFTNMIGGRCHSTWDCELPFDWIQIWSKMWIQLYSCHNSTTLLPSQGLHASLANAKWLFSHYDAAIISSDGNKDWLCNGLQGES